MESNILIIVEGLKTEPNFFKRLSDVFALKFDIYCLETNIYSLYKKMKEIDFNGDIKDVLSEIHPSKKEMLSKKFAYTYLIFDCDAHHAGENETRTQEEIVFTNLDKLSEMANYFVDETDPSIGRLYINYPMMESYRDCDDYFENEYASAIVSILKLSSYKNYVAKKKLCSKHIDKYTKEQFSLLILQNLYKLNLICGQKWNKPNYKEYSSYSDSANILSEERKLATKDKVLYVINTSLFMITDYFGNRNGFYEGLNLQKQDEKT